MTDETVLMGFAFAFGTKSSGGEKVQHDWRTATFSELAVAVYERSDVRETGACTNVSCQVCRSRIERRAGLCSLSLTGQSTFDYFTNVNDSPVFLFLKLSSFNTSTFSKLFNQLVMIIYEFIFGIAHVNKDFLMPNKYF